MNVHTVFLFDTHYDLQIRCKVTDWWRFLYIFSVSCLSWWNKLSVFTRHTMNTRLHRRIYIVYSVASNIQLLSIHWQSEQLVWSSGNLSIDYFFIIQTTVVIIIWNSWTKYPLVNISVIVDKLLWSVKEFSIKRNC